MQGGKTLHTLVLPIAHAIDIKESSLLLWTGCNDWLQAQLSAMLRLGRDDLLHSVTANFPHSSRAHILGSSFEWMANLGRLSAGA